MKNNFLRLVVVFNIIVILASCSQDNGAGGNMPPPNPELAGTYQTVRTDPGLVRATISISSDNVGNILGHVTVGGAVACFSEGSFNSVNSASRFDPQSRTGTIEASSGSSKALLYFSVSSDYISLEIEGGRSKLMNGNGTCVVLENLKLRKKIEIDR